MRYATVANVLRKKYSGDNEGYISLRVGIPGYPAKPKFRSYSYRIKAADWDEQNEIVKKSHKDYNQINAEIIAEKEKWIEHFRKEVKKGIILTPEYVAKALKPKIAKGTFLQFYGAYLEVIVARHSKSYADHFLIEYNQLRKFGGDSLGFEDITATFLEEYEMSLKVAPTTLHTKMKRLKEVVDRAIARGQIEQRQIADYDWPGYDEPDTNYLTLEQTIKIADNIYNGEYDYEPNIKLVACFFLIECYSGIRFSDWNRFEVEKLVHDRNLKVRAKKNGEPVYLPLKVFKRLAKIVDYIAKNNLHFDLSLHETNKMLKVIGVQLKLKFGLRTHIGRHTCGTLLGEMGYSTRSIADVLGVSEQTAKRYVKQTRQSLNYEFETKGGL